MHPVNKEFITPEELRAEAAILSRTAGDHSAKGLLTSAADLATRALNKLKLARNIENASGLRAAADYLEEMRNPGTSVTLAPEGAHFGR